MFVFSTDYEWLDGNGKVTAKVLIETAIDLDCFTLRDIWDILCICKYVRPSNSGIEDNYYEDDLPVTGTFCPADGSVFSKDVASRRAIITTLLASMEERDVDNRTNEVVRSELFFTDFWAKRISVPGDEKGENIKLKNVKNDKIKLEKKDPSVRKKQKT